MCIPLFYSLLDHLGKMLYNTKKLDLLPLQCGVYLMKDSKGVILYVGKANSLRQRVKQYFAPGRDTREIIPYLIAHVSLIDTIIVSSEKEALLLENTLIKQHQPKYNALLKDDKGYIALKITHKSKWPKLQLVRYKGKPPADGLYFGPYTSALSARKTFDLISHLFPLRQCSDQELVRRTRPCILYDMKRCIAPCVNKCTKAEYDHHVERTVKFLRGQDKEVLKDLYTELQELSQNLEFEKAHELLKTIRQIEGTIEEQHVDRLLGGDADLFALFRQAEEVIIAKIVVRNGKLLDSRAYNFSNIVEDDEELLTSFLLQHYAQQQEIPKEILVSIDLPDSRLIEEILQEKKSSVRIFRPLRGDKSALMELAQRNAEASFKKEKNEQAIREKTLFEMQDQFHLTRYPEIIECFDNSHTAGSEPVSSLVVFRDGKKDTRHYRKYALKTVKPGDDYGSMYEVLSRRYKRAKEEDTLPDLLIVDGGKGHLQIALKVLAELNIITLDVIGVAKEEGRHDKGSTAEKVFLPNIKDPIFLRRTSPVLFLLQQMRDEAHRFAITFHRQRRSKKLIKSALEDIPGIGPVKRKALLRHFGSVKKLREASPEELKAVKEINRTDIQTILDWKAELSN